MNLFEQQKTEMSCCADADDCHDSKEDKKGCADGNCPSNDCQLQQLSVKLISENKLEVESIPDFQLNSQKNSFYKSLIFKDLSYSFWHPPRYIS